MMSVIIEVLLCMISYIIYIYIIDTGSSSHLDTIMKSYTPLKMAGEICDIRQINLTGE